MPGCRTDMNVTAVLFCIGLLVHIATCEHTEYRLVCYVTGDTHTHPALASLDQTNAHLCTHVIYALIDQDSSVEPFPPEHDSALSLLRKLKESNPDLKMLLAKGSWTSTNTRLVDMTLDHGSLEMFVDWAVNHLRLEGFDGLDVVWLTGSQTDENLLTLLLKELRGAFQEESLVSGRDALLLSTAVSAQDTQAYDARSFPQYVDFISLVTYDVQRPSGTAPDLEHLATYWRSQGVESEKLTLGIPLHAPELSSHGNETHPAGVAGRLQENSEEYPQMCRFIMCHAHHGDHRPRYSHRHAHHGDHRPHSSHRHAHHDDDHRPPRSGHRHAHHDDHRPRSGHRHAHHDDHRPRSSHTHSLRGKVRELRSLGLGGVTLWSLDLDDPSGAVCGQGSFPFARELRSALWGRQPQHCPHHRRHHQHHHRHGPPAHDDHHPGHDHCHRHRVLHDMDSPRQHTTFVT